jgi:uncharacterized protein YjiS (DUF1127 family)
LASQSFLLLFFWAQKAHFRIEKCLFYAYLFNYIANIISVVRNLREKIQNRLPLPCMNTLACILECSLPVHQVSDVGIKMVQWFGSCGSQQPRAGTLLGIL